MGAKKLAIIVVITLAVITIFILSTHKHVEYDMNNSTHNYEKVGTDQKQNNFKYYDFFDTVRDLPDNSSQTVIGNSTSAHTTKIVAAPFE